MWRCCCCSSRLPRRRRAWTTISWPRAKPTARARRAKVAAYAKRFKGHILEPYLAYWQLSPRLEQASPAEVRAFLSSYRDTPLAERLRVDWLKLLGKNQQWDVFDEELPRVVNDDLELDLLRAAVAPCA